MLPKMFRLWCLYQLHAYLQQCTTVLCRLLEIVPSGVVQLYVSSRDADSAPFLALLSPGPKRNIYSGIYAGPGILLARVTGLVSSLLPDIALEEQLDSSPGEYDIFPVVLYYY